MKTKFLSLLLVLAFTSCASRTTPFGKDVTVGTDTKGYVAASGNAEFSINGGSLKADKILLIDDENQSASFSKAVGLGQTIVRWYTAAGAIKSLGKVGGSVLRSKEATARTVSNNAASVEQAKIAADVSKTQIEADAATSQLQITNP
jgi:hypothetical protein